MTINQILTKLGIESLNAMQQEVMEQMLRTRNDVVALSPTGTGKTLAYLLPLVQMTDIGSNDVQAIVVAPGRELALQSHDVLKSMGAGVRSQACYGGRATMDEHRVLRKNQPHVVFGTPGRLNDHIEKGNIDIRHVRYVIIDEFDKCLEMGFQGEMERLMNQLPFVERRVLLSATEAEQIPRFVNLSHTQVLNYLVAEETVSERVETFAVKSPQKDKLDTLSLLLRTIGSQQSVVFLNYRDSVERTSDYLRHQGFVVSTFHGGLEQRQREDALYQFSNGSANVLVCTDLASRGLDIPQIDNIIHYHLPANEATMVHRVGRTARWDATGRTFFIIGPGEQLAIDTLELVDFPLQDNPGLALPVPAMATIYIGKGKKDKISKVDIVGYLCKKGGLEPGEIGRIDVTDRYAYAAVKREKLQQVVRQTRGEKIKGIRTVVEPVR